VPGFPHRQWQGRLPSSPRRVCGRVSSPNAAAQRAGVACAAGSPARPLCPSVPCRCRDAPGRSAMCHGRAECPAPGRAHGGVPAPYDCADLAGGCGGPWWGPGMAVAVGPCLGAVPPAVTGARQHGAPEVAAARTVQAGASGACRRTAPRTAGGARSAPRVAHPPPQTVPGAAWPGGCGPRAQRARADAVRLGAPWTASPPCVRGGGTSPTVSRLRPCVAGVHRGPPPCRATPPRAALACAGGRVVRVRGGVWQAGAVWGQAERGRPGGGGAAGPNKAVEPTAPMGAVWPAGAVQGAAAHRRR